RRPEVGSDRWCVTWKLYHPDGTPMPHDACPMAVALREGRPVRNAEAIAETPDGRRIWFEPYPTPLRDATGAVTGGVNVLRDISARKEMERELRRRTAQLDAFLETAVVGLHRVDADGRIVWANAAEADLLGYTVDEYVGRDIRDMHVDREAIEEILARLRAGEALREFEAQLRAKDGSVRTVLIDSSGYFEDGRFVHSQCITRDVTERKKAEEAVARLAAIVESSDDAIVSKTLDGVIRSWNRGAEAMFGYTAEEAIGRRITLIIPDHRLSEEDDVLARLRRGEKIDHYETVRRRKDGRLIDVSLTVSPLRDRTGRIIGAAKVARDITDRKRLEAARLADERAARNRAERMNEAKDEFLAVVSHELRTPLNAILGWAHVMASESTDAARMKEGLEAIRRNALQQSQLVSDLLDVSSIVAGVIRLANEEVLLDRVVSAAVQAFRPAAEAKGVRLEADAAGNLVVLGDPQRLQQIVGNLLGNAVKFTAPGGRVSVRAFTPDGRRAEIFVEDDGQGIPPEQFERLFERFRQGDASSTRRHGGLGLGLSIVKRLTDLQGGTVDARSAGPGKGAVFTVRLPLRRSSSASDDSSRPRPTRTNGAPH
ncbi:MAG TPA: PAS domain S-box protein, partial [Planctomycetota bacterium]|nr:PAS domain S-box protein [Planctomycetota bacterium]